MLKVTNLSIRKNGYHIGYICIKHICNTDELLLKKKNNRNKGITILKSILSIFNNINNFFVYQLKRKIKHS